MTPSTVISRCLFVAWIAACSACGPESAPKPSSQPTQGPKPLSQRINEKNGYQVDAEGNWKPINNRRSDFESQGQSPYFKGEIHQHAYQTKSIEKTSWWGNQSYQTKTYKGNTDASKFQKASSLSGQSARESLQDAGLERSYQTGSYETHAAREAAANPIARPTDAETQQRRKVFTPPEIIDWQEQRQMDIQQSKSMLGR